MGEEPGLIVQMDSQGLSQTDCSFVAGCHYSVWIAWAP